MSYEVQPAVEVLPPWRHEAAADPSEHDRAVTSLQLAAAQLHDFFRLGDPRLAEELDCYLMESGAGQPAETLLSELAEAVTVLGQPQRGQP